MYHWLERIRLCSIFETMLIPVLYKFIASLALLCGSALAYAQPLQISVKVQDSVDRLVEAPVQITLTGQIDADAPRRLSEVLKAHSGQAISAHLNSPGGNLMAGLKIGRLLRSVRASTYVGYDSSPGVCFSACAFAYLGGAFRYMPSRSSYGVHRASTIEQSHDTIESGQVVAAITGAYIREMGADASLLDLSVTASADDIYILSKKQLEELRVVNNGSSAPKWEVDVVDGGTYLIGEQTHYHGTGKFRLICGAKGQLLMSSYTAGDKAEYIVKGWQHSLFIDDETLPLAEPEGIKNHDGVIFALFSVSDRQLKSMLNAKSVGHAMQLNRSAPTFVGYRVSIDSESSDRYNAYVRNCIRKLKP